MHRRQILVSSFARGTFIHFHISHGEAQIVLIFVAQLSKLHNRCIEAVLLEIVFGLAVEQDHEETTDIH